MQLRIVLTIIALSVATIVHSEQSFENSLGGYNIFKSPIFLKAHVDRIETVNFDPSSHIANRGVVRLQNKIATFEIKFSHLLEKAPKHEHGRKLSSYYMNHIDHTIEFDDLEEQFKNDIAWSILSCFSEGKVAVIRKQESAPEESYIVFMYSFVGDWSSSGCDVYAFKDGTIFFTGIDWIACGYQLVLPEGNFPEIFNIIDILKKHPDSSKIREIAPADRLLKNMKLTFPKHLEESISRQWK